MTNTLVESVLDTTIEAAFRKSVDKYPQNIFIAVPAAVNRDYYKNGFEISYADAAARIELLKARFKEAGYGIGHRIAVALDNRPEHILVRLALNGLGISCVPINPDYRASELAYVLQHSEAALIIHLECHKKNIKEANKAIDCPVPTLCFQHHMDSLPVAKLCGGKGELSPCMESSLLYTSGTTGAPKGCMLSNQYELMSGAWYASLGGMSTIREGKERVFNPLPLYHINSGTVSTIGMMLTGGCQIQPDRFHPRSWWRDVAETRATVIHYLGVVAPMLLNLPVTPAEREHSVRFGFGAGVEPGLHEIFENRFGFPLIEVWGMTEMVRVLAANTRPRKRGTRAIGYPKPGLEAEVHDEEGKKVPPGVTGELVVRYSVNNPRLGSFLGYLKDEEATKRAWSGGWFHTGDNVYQAEDGMMHFVDRMKNIIRRSGENIAAAEIEGVLQECEEVAQVAVLAVSDAIREEEVMACIVPAEGSRADERLAHQLFSYCNRKLAYYKPPGWIKFYRELPRTGSQKIQKHLILKKNAEPLKIPDVIDLRHMKRRNNKE
ncbi:MAG: long-chain fatty acid--CoA ligase [Rhodospirillaceae bacterium]|nr:long-chain fatty acid--CoA ligase [Rhodospirillaceae bacterium]